MSSRRIDFNRSPARRRDPIGSNRRKLSRQSVYRRIVNQCTRWHGTWHVSLGLTVLLCVRAAAACTVPDAIPVGPPATECEVLSGPIHAIPTTRDRIGRILVPVFVNGVGPYRFILDTGANRSVLAPHVAEALQLSGLAAAPVEVHGVTGSVVLPTVLVERLEAGSLVIARNQRVPVLSGTMLADADGILGIDGMAGSRIEVDFVSDEVRVERSNRRAAPHDMLSVPVSLRHHGLLVTNARVGRVRIKAIIDTGAERSLGNQALFEALGTALKAQVAEATVQGASPEVRTGKSFLAPTISLGEVQLENLEVTFGHLHVFELWNLEKQPALLIGMDLIGTARRLVIDYRRRELQVAP